MPSHHLLYLLAKQFIASFNTAGTQTGNFSGIDCFNRSYWERLPLNFNHSTALTKLGGKEVFVHDRLLNQAHDVVNVGTQTGNFSGIDCFNRSYWERLPLNFNHSTALTKLGGKEVFVHDRLLNQAHDVVNVGTQTGNFSGIDCFNRSYWERLTLNFNHSTALTKLGGKEGFIHDRLLNQAHDVVNVGTQTGNFSGIDCFNRSYWKRLPLNFNHSTALTKLGGKEGFIHDRLLNQAHDVVNVGTQTGNFSGTDCFNRSYWERLTLNFNH